MIGTIFNVIMILVGSTIGSLFKKGISRCLDDSHGARRLIYRG